MNKFDRFYLRNADKGTIDRMPKLKYSKWVFMFFSGIPALIIVSPKIGILFAFGSSSLSVFASHYLYVMIKYQVIIGNGSCWEYNPKSTVDFLCYWTVMIIFGAWIIISIAAGLTAVFRHFG